MATLGLKKNPDALAIMSPTAPHPAPVPLDASHFWIVWRVGGSRPKRRHASLEAAVAERDRLIAELPQSEFLIFECKAVTE